MPEHVLRLPAPSFASQTGKVLLKRLSAHPSGLPRYSAAIVLMAALLSPALAHAESCVRGERTPNGIVYPLGVVCPGDNPWARPSQDEARQSYADDVSRREARQGRVRRMSGDQCSAVLAGVPNGVAPLGPSWHPGEPSPTNPYMTAQENWCLALGRGHESVASTPFPGLLPDGYHATYLGNGHWRVSP